jgi:hypothetical protein
MKNKEINERLKNIKIQIKSNDIKFRAHALIAFTDLLRQNKIDNDLISFIKPILKENISDQYSSLKTDSIKAACFMILQNLSENEDLIKILLAELKENDKYRSEVILDTFSKLSNSNNKEIKEAIIRILKETPNLFNKPRFIPLIHDFWRGVLDQNYSFIDKYRSHIEKILKTYPDEFSEICDFIYKKIADYQAYMDEIKTKRRKERKLREEKIEEKQKQSDTIASKASEERQETSEIKDIFGKKEIKRGTTFSDLGFKRKDDEDD